MTKIYDLAIIGGGVNGCGIARDATGRGLSVFLCEQGDLADLDLWMKAQTTPKAITPKSASGQSLRQ